MSNWGLKLRLSIWENLSSRNHRQKYQILISRAELYLNQFKFLGKGKDQSSSKSFYTIHLQLKKHSRTLWITNYRMEMIRNHQGHSKFTKSNISTQIPSNWTLMHWSSFVIKPSISTYQISNPGGFLKRYSSRKSGLKIFHMCMVLSSLQIYLLPTITKKTSLYSSQKWSTLPKKQ